MKTVTRNDIAAAFAAVGIRPGDTLMLHSDIARIGPVAGAKDRNGLLDAWLGGIRDALGAGGTLVVLTSTEAYARSNTPFIYEESPSEQGVLADHVRQQPGALRSMHPLFSLTALGPGADAICAGVAPTGYGHESPFDRLHRENAWIACLGVDLLAMSFTHHIEQMFGVPYGYTKEWRAPIWRASERIDRRFFAFVRYLDAGVEYDFTRFQSLMLERGAAHKATLGYGTLHAVRAKDAFAIGVEQLKQDIFFFLEAPPAEEPWRSPPIESEGK